MLSDVISGAHRILLLRFLPGNIILTHETMHWARTSRQYPFFYKIFFKAYDKVSWRFPFHAMQTILMNEKISGSVKLLFGNALAVNLNGSPCNNFKVQRGVRQNAS